MESTTAETTEGLRRTMENLERHLLEARAIVESKDAELQEVQRERDDFEDAVAGAERKLSEKEEELIHVRQELNDVLTSEKVLRDHADRLASKLEVAQLQLELDKLPALESLRAEHQTILERELRRAEELRQEKIRSDERVIWLESQLQAAIQAKSFAAEAEHQGDPGLELAPVAAHRPSTGYSDVEEEQRSGTASPPGGSYPPRNVDHEPLQTLLQTECMYKQEVSNVGHADTHTTEYVMGPTAKSFEPVGTRKDPPPLLPQASLTCGIEQPNIVHSMAKLLQAQTEMLSAQVHAVALQSLPALPHFAGQDVDSTTDEDSFDRWLEQLEERGRLAGWTSDQLLCQLKAHLEKTALQVFRMLTSEERNDYVKAIAALRKRFKPVAIEELRGMEFHQLIQESQSIEQLGIELQRLARRAFPTISGKDRDILLKGRFYQALLPKWQRKVVPKPEETFTELYDRARTLEKYEKQYAASAAARAENKTDRRHASNYGKQKSNQRVPNNNVATNSNPNKLSSENATLVPNSESSNVLIQQRTAQSSGASQLQDTKTCYRCGETGHYARNCKVVTSKSQNEARGRSTSTTSRSAAVKSESSNPQKFTEEQLEEMLAKIRLEKETSMLQKQSADVDTISAETCAITDAVGPTLYVDLSIEGVPVQAMVDTGSQSTIISRDLLHKIGKHRTNQGKPLPQLKVPTVRLFGKDGKKNQCELNISAETVLTVETDGTQIQTPVFIQPDSDQLCLLGMNAAPALNLQFLRANGVPLKSMADMIVIEKDTAESNVYLVESATIPARKGRFLEAMIEPSVEKGAQLLFEPKVQSLQTKGFTAQEALVSTTSSGKILVPLFNMEFSNSDVKAGDVIGTVELIGNEISHDKCLSSSCAQVQVQTPTTISRSDIEVQNVDRKSKLKQQLKLTDLQTDLTRTGISTEQVKELEKVLLAADDVFALDESELGHTSLVTHLINTGDHPPIKQRPRRIPFCHKEKVCQLVSDMLEKQVIQPSSSAWASPIVLVPKKDGTQRFCVDYRRLNAVTKKDVYPLPRIDDILDTLSGTKYFSTLDLCSGYWQIQLHPKVREKSAFTTHTGLYEFTRMPFGLCNAPATFQRLLQTVLSGLEGKFCFVYIDDILVCSKSFEEHLQHLQEIFERLRKANLTLKPKKCSFLQRQVAYLGHVISSDGISPDPSKIQKVRDYPVPTDVKKVRQFLGLASYYRRFIPGFAKIANPLHALTKKEEVFQWSVKCQAAFDLLKQKLISAPVLSYPRFGPEEKFIVETDASSLGIGAVLAQKQKDGYVHPVAYASRTLNPHERNYAITELETLALVWALKQFRAYILGHHCTVFTDHSACSSLLNSSNPSAKLARWAMSIQDLDLDIKYRSGKINLNADALSRNHSQAESSTGKPAALCREISSHTTDSDNLDHLTNAMQEIAEQKLQKINIQQPKDSELNEIILYLEENQLPEDMVKAKKIALESSQYELLNGVLYHTTPAQPGTLCVVVPQDLRTDLLTEAHSGKFSGHFAERRVYNLLRCRYWWKGMHADVKRHCRACLTCATRKGTGRAFKPPLQPIPVGGPFHRVGVDVLQLPLTESGNQYVVIFLDYLTKWVEAFAVPDQSAITIAKLLVEEIFCRHGAPEHLLSDRGANFLSNLIQDVCKYLNIKKVNTSGYHPQTDGLVERFNSTLINMLSKCAKKNGKDWDKQLPYVLFAYRASVQASTKESPFYLLYGRDPRLPSECALTVPTTPYMIDLQDYRSELTTSLSDAWLTAKEHIAHAQDKQKQQYDKKAKESPVKVGDRVMVHMPGTVKGKAWKLVRPFHGPYRVVSVTPTNAEVRLVDQPEADSIFVSLSRVRPCYSEMADVSWSGNNKSQKKNRKQTAKHVTTTIELSVNPHTSGPVTRAMTRLQEQQQQPVNSAV